ncbi:MAG: hypothetical protein Q7R87_02380 [Nanoarchaeota archaeon]|nr:hypothetical protein [Nanoarchaeota archaeon]
MASLNLVWDYIVHYLSLTLESDVLWEISPMIIATVLTIAYFQRYDNEKPSWESYYSTSIVLLFVSLSLLRYVYNINDAGAYNFIEYQAKSLAAVFILFLGFVLIKFNFEHLLPERYALYVSSPLTIHLIAFAVILFVHSDRLLTWVGFLSLVIIVAVLSLILNSIKFPLHKMFIFMKKEKEKDEIKSVKEVKFEIDELRRKIAEKKRNLKFVKKVDVDKPRSIAKKIKKLLR